MYLQRLEIYGFKSFAQKMVLEFLTPQNKTKGITAIVGPNGSGKSNVADAIRWVLGEQSIKTLRGKKGEDVIFAGSDKKTRLGMAEVSLLLNNEDMEAPIDVSEALMTRRLYRDGGSEYMLNGHNARLQDIALLLARARFGQKNYVVIGQGMVDSILRVTPRERKDFFDEAAGVREFQIKRHIALNKLKATYRNLQQAESLIREIEPRLRSLNRQVKRLADREAVERELKDLQKQYYGHLWWDLDARHGEFDRQFQRLDEQSQKKKAEHRAILGQFKELEERATASQAFLDLQKKYEDTLHQREELQRKKMEQQSQLEIDRIRQTAQKIATPMPVGDIIREVEIVVGEQGKLVDKVLHIKSLDELDELGESLRALQAKMNQLLARLRNPLTEKKEYTPNPQLVSGLAAAEEGLKKFSAELAHVNSEMQRLNKEENEKKGQFFELQHTLQQKQEEVHEIDQHLNNVKIELAKLDTRRETLEEEMSTELGPLAAEVKIKKEVVPGPETPVVPATELQPQIFKLKHQLELIGGIDPEAVAEHKETSERFDFLSTQVNDLKKAMEDTIKSVLEMDKIMKAKRDEALKKINEEFGNYFKILFNGGTAKLVPLYEEADKEKADEVEEEGVADLVEEEAEEESEESANSEKGIEELFKQFKVDKEPALIGIEIQATPPGKHIKDINILSGGERALTSVGLICAILAYSPSPFVVLDEVDAALDEFNSIRFAEIMDKLSERTQFIVITHNRATMHKAQVLYGVTMGDDGVSRLLSIKLDDAEKVVAGYKKK